MNPLRAARADVAHTVFAGVSLLMLIGMIFTVGGALRARTAVFDLREQAAQSADRLLASCERDDRLRAAIAFLLVRDRSAEALALAADPALQTGSCLSIYPKETP